MINKKNRILYLHTGIRTYRIKLFQLLSKKFNIDFFLTENVKKDRHVIDEYEKLMNDSNVNILQASEIESLPFYGFSLDLLKLPFLKYNVFIFTSSVSVPFLLMAPIVKLFSKKVIVFDELWRYPKEVYKYKIIFPYVKFLLKYFVDSVIVSGTKSKDLYLNTYNYERDRIYTAYNTTIDIKQFLDNEDLNKKIKDRLNNYSQNKKILYLARVIEIKGLDLLIRSMKNISNNYDLFVIGEGEYLEYCKNLTNELNLNNRVFFLGDCLSSETVYYYNNCDLYVLPTKKQLNRNVQVESWGFTINEAMSMELPIVTTDAVGSAYDLVKDGENGAIALSSSVESLSEKINYVIDNNEKNIMGKKSREILLSKCDYEKNIFEYENAILNALKDGGN